MRKLFALLLSLLLCLLILPTFGTAATANPWPGALYPVRIGGLWGYMDYQGSILIRPQWVSAGQFRNGAAVVGTESGDGIIDTTGTYIVEPVYSIDQGYDGFYYGGRETGVIYVMKKTESGDWLAGFYDVPSGSFAQPQWYEIYPFRNNNGRLIMVEGAEDTVEWWRSDGYADRTTGRMAIPYQYYENGYAAEFYEGFALVDAFLDENQTDYETFFINEAGERLIIHDGIIPHYVGRFSEGLALVQNAETGLYGYITPSGMVAIQPQFEEANDFSEGYASVQVSGLWGHIDRTGTMAGEPRYTGREWGYYFVNGLAIVTVNNRYGAIDAKGDLVFLMDEDVHRLESFMDNGLAVFYCIEWDNWGLVNREGHIVLDPAEGYRFEATYYLGSSQEYFSEGLQTLSKDGLCGFIDEQGQVATPFEWDYCENFHNGLAYVKRGDKMAYIDHTGTVVWAEK